MEIVAGIGQDPADGTVEEFQKDCERSRNAIAHQIKRGKTLTVKNVETYEEKILGRRKGKGNLIVIT